MSAGKNFTICLLFYGDYPELAARCLASFSNFYEYFDLRVGINDISKRTQAVLYEGLSKFQDAGVSCKIYEGVAPYYKYPLMREMFHNSVDPIVTPYVMWFDDDSYIKAEAGASWFEDIQQYFTGSSPVDILGKVYTGVFAGGKKGLQGGQPLWVESQPWYTGEPVDAGHQPRFCTGGWWTTRSTILQKWSWPPEGNYHNCGDYLFGELFRQQKYVIKNFGTGVAINADDFGSESKAVRRGTKFVPLAMEYKKEISVTKSGLDFSWMNILDGRA